MYDKKLGCFPEGCAKVTGWVGRNPLWVTETCWINQQVLALNAADKHCEDVVRREACTVSPCGNWWEYSGIFPVCIASHTPNTAASLHACFEM